MKIHGSTICKNCGGEYGIHHYQTDQCPVGGREAPINRTQEYKTLIFEPEIDEELHSIIKHKTERPSLSGWTVDTKSLKRASDKRTMIIVRKSKYSRKEVVAICGVVGDVDEKERTKNAHIISASLELLDALVPLVQLIEVTFPKQQEVWLADARAAIAKAKGE